MPHSRKSMTHAITRLLVLVLSLSCATIWLTNSAYMSGKARQTTLVQAESSSIRQITLPANDLVYDKNTGKIYASVPSVAGANGNSLTPINPATGTIGSSVFMGSEPNRLAISDNGQYIYAALDGAYAVRRFDVAAQTAGLQFNLGRTTSGDPYKAYDLAVMPGNPQSLAVSRINSTPGGGGGVAIYDNDTQRQTTGGGGYLEFSASADALYAYSSFYFGSINSLQKFTVSASGLTAGSPQINTDNGGDFRFDNGRIYMLNGKVYAADTGALLGTFPDVGSYSYGNLIVPDSSVGRVYFLSGGSSGGTSTLTLRAYDMNTFVLVGTLSIPNVNGAPGGLVRWGANGLAFRTGSNLSYNNIQSGNQVYLIQTSLIPSSEPVPPSPSPTASPVASPTASPTPTPFETSLRQISLPTKDIIFDPSRQTIYASVPSAAGANGNSLTPINPATGTVNSSVFIGSEPGKLAISDNGQYIYAGLDGANAVRRFDTAAQTAGLQFSLNSGSNAYKAFDLAVLPGRATSIAVSKSPAGQSGLGGVVAIYDDGTQRPTTSTPSPYTLYTKFSASAATLYGLANYGNGLQKIAVTDSGATVASSVQLPIGGDFRFDNGRIYLPSGQVIDPETGTLVGTFTGLSSNYGPTVVAPDSKNQRVYFVSQTAYDTATLRVYDMRTFLPLGSVAIPGIIGAPSSLVRWGTNGLAFRTLGNTNGNTGTTGGQVFLLRSALIDPTEKIASSIKFASSVYNVSESAGFATITVNRFGDNSGTARVDYATSNGTAIDNRDYTLASGTLTFAPGETSKTFTVLITDDAYAESSETINLTLGNAVEATLGSPSTAVLTIIDNDGATQPTYNPIDFEQFFVRQHYSDFLNRAPDTGGLNYWTALIAKCASNDAKCINSSRVSVSAAFFIEQEFQDTGGYVYRFYKASYGQPPTYAQFMPDRSRVVGGANLEAGKQAFADAWVQRPEFLARYPQSMTGTQFIDALLQTVRQGSGVDLSSQRDALIADYNANQSRARIVRLIADAANFKAAEYNKAFVLMQYFGYLRRDPDQGGYDFWLDVLNNRVANNYRAMVCAFVTSAEYQDRFSSVRTRTDSVCGQIGQ